LGWEVLTAMPDYAGIYRTIVDTENGDILYCKQLIQTALAQAQIFRVNPGISDREAFSFPLAAEEFDLPSIPVPDGFPAHWVTENQTVGNSTFAHVGDNGPPLRGAMQDEDIVRFDVTDGSGSDQQVLNIFYYNCFMHDFFYLLGFREEDGNFQNDNFSRGGVQSDSVDSRAHPGPVFGTANMGTPVDGRRPVMNMGLVASTGRHTAFDSSVVFHEFMHGVTNRLVGGPLNDRALEARQSGGMGEGWGDYIACVLNNTTVVGDWVVNNPRGIRGFPYDSNFPDNFGDLGTGRYSEVHNIGEIWAATLMEMTRNIGNKGLALQLVVDALKLSPANPSFLDMRDAILRALDDMLTAVQLSADQHASARQGIWRAFAKFGMGPGAQSNGAQLSGIVANFDLPADLPPGDA
jgi:extracellular elastinolytic metalloproteinase